MYQVGKTEGWVVMKNKGVRHATDLQPGSAWERHTNEINYYPDGTPVFVSDARGDVIRAEDVFETQREALGDALFRAEVAVSRCQKILNGAVKRRDAVRAEFIAATKARL